MTRSQSTSPDDGIAFETPPIKAARAANLLMRQYQENPEPRAADYRAELRRVYENYDPLITEMVTKTWPGPVKAKAFARTIRGFIAQTNQGATSVDIPHELTTVLVKLAARYGTEFRSYIDKLKRVSRTYGLECPWGQYVLELHHIQLVRSRILGASPRHWQELAEELGKVFPREHFIELAPGRNLGPIKEWEPVAGWALFHTALSSYE